MDPAKSGSRLDSPAPTSIQVILLLVMALETESQETEYRRGQLRLL